MTARYLEANGIPTVIIGSARDIVEHCGVPRFVYSDFPLGNPCGHPWQPTMQDAIVRLALGQLETAAGARSFVRSPFDWKGGPEWRERYNQVRPEDREKLLAIGDARRLKRGQAPRTSK
ncbi:MAG TPA: hypothetical protein PK264_07690 [Hyphomicrobiaceae bacterium]|nr:hypothetical protein [Hyphomicrobiaceae bacterium]